jgi:hypothetical protein
MAMSADTAERWVVVSAAATAGIYFYRQFTEGSSPPATLKRVAGVGKPPVPLGAFATAWGFTYLVLAMMASAAPGLGGGFAILIMTADFLTNANSVFTDVLGLEQSAGATGTSSSSTTTAAQQQAAIATDVVAPLDPFGAWPSAPSYLPSTPAPKHTVGYRPPPSVTAH